ncbi:MAG: pseudouridine-5'-phosphate glycosidase [Myxococcales bacterium]|nr:pseudouridine-5'-phosphate glycosidase [Myxococcales bacterium]
MSPLRPENSNLLQGLLPYVVVTPENRPHFDLAPFGLAIAEAHVIDPLHTGSAPFLERLETLGVPVLGYGTAELPAFYHGRSGLPVSYRVDDPATVARIMAVQYEQLAGGGLLVCQPPPEAEAQDPAVVDALIQGALAAAEAAGVKGRAVTPFLLGALDQASGGDVVRTNVALVAHNTRLAARIAVADQRPRDE